MSSDVVVPDLSCEVSCGSGDSEWTSVCAVSKLVWLWDSLISCDGSGVTLVPVWSVDTDLLCPGESAVVSLGYDYIYVSSACVTAVELLASVCDGGATVVGYDVESDESWSTVIDVDWPSVDSEVCECVEIGTVMSKAVHNCAYGHHTEAGCSYVDKALVCRMCC